MMSSRSAAVLGFLVLGTFGVAACDGGGGTQVCSPGELRDCACTDAPAGQQTCAQDGRAWGTCDCSCTPDCQGKACGSDGCGGTCGACESPPAAACEDAGTLRTWAASGTCVLGACQYVPSLQPCDFGCQAGVCTLDPCISLRCDDPPDACHSAAGRCVREPELHCVYDPLADGTPCEDGLACNGAESCLAGACAPGAPVDCSALDAPCRSGRCDEESGACVQELLADGAACEDGSFCNGAETCLAGDCLPGAALDCSAHDGPCTLGVCRESPPGCAAEPANEGLACPDGSACNGQETCHAGACLPGPPVECAQPPNPCERATCEEAGGLAGCQVSALWDGEPCTTGAACVSSEACQAGVCVPLELAPAGTPCEDGDPCTQEDTCLAGACQPGPYGCMENVVLMMYLDADNNLDPDITADWHEMEAAGVDGFPWLRVFVVIDHSGNNDTHFYEVHDGASTELAGPAMGLTVSGAEELNMGHPDTLRHFIEDVKAVAGGRNTSYFLILSDHGDGWRSGIRPEPHPTVRAVCGDDTNGGDYLYTSELGEAVAFQDLRLIGFDACLMAMAEVAYQLRDDADVLVLSQETEPGPGWDYEALLGQFGQGGDPRPATFGQLVADTYMSSYAGMNSDLTMAVYDQAGLEALRAAAEPVAGALQALPAADWNQICGGLEWYGCFWTWCMPHADLVQLATRAKARDAAHAAEYDALIQAVADTVLYERHGSGHPNSHGMNVYFPCEETFDPAYSATNLEWAADTSWETMLQAH